MTEWREVSLADVCERVDYGYTASATDDPTHPRFLRITDIVKPQIDWDNVPGCPIDDASLAKYALSEGDIVVARTGATVGYAKLIRSHPEAVFASYLVRFRPSADVVPGFVGAVVESSEYKEWVAGNAGGAAQPNANAKVLGSYTFRLPDEPTQRRVAGVAAALSDLIENNRRRVEVLEEMARAIYREWFVHFRFPGHEDATFVDSVLGPIPEGWSVASVESLGAAQKWAITGGPFGSKLGRKDYVDDGVPVLRGANLSVGGGFDDSDLVFVTQEKADELRSCWAVPGDVVITQRGTLGQIGLIPMSSSYEHYVISQSQMKVTLDEDKLTNLVFYEQMRSPEVTERFIARAMTAGVPHLNLGLLREFTVLVPALMTQQGFGEVVDPLHSAARSLLDQTTELEEIRDLLLPKLVTGQIDVSDLDLDAVVEKAGV